MAEPENESSSTGKSKGKMSHLDDDISKDFLISWKPMSMTGSDDMDFNFEPVTNGNKKAFDFGKFDMDFSLDGEFGKLPSFKLDMPDLDFSSSPKKSTKSNEKSDDESIKGNRQTKKNEFAFSFDFNGLNEFTLDTPSIKGGSKPSRGKSSKDVRSMDGIVCDDLPRQVAKDNGGSEETISKKPAAASQDALNSKSEDLVNGEGNPEASPRKCPSIPEIFVNHIQPKETHVCSDKILAANAQEMGDHSLLSVKASYKSYAQETIDDSDSTPDLRSTFIPVAMQSTNTHVTSETEITVNSQGSCKEFQATENTLKSSSYVELKAKDPPPMPTLVKASIQATLSEGMDGPADGTVNDPPSETYTAIGILPSAESVILPDTDKLKPEKPSEQLLPDKISTCDEKNEQKAVVASSADLASNIVDTSPSGIRDTLSSCAKYQAEAPRSVSKFFSAPFGSRLTAAKPSLIAYQVPGCNNSKSSMLRETNGGGRTNLSMLGKDRENTMQFGAENRREGIENKLDSSSNSSIQVLVNQDQVSESTEKKVDAENGARTMPTVCSESNDNVNGRIRNQMIIDTISNDGQAMKAGLVMLGSEKKINDSKSSSFQVSSSVFSGQEAKFINQDNRKLASITKSNVSEPNKLSSPKYEKKLPGLPSLKISGNTTTMKHTAGSSINEKAKSVVKPEKSVRFQTMINTVLSIGNVKQSPSTPSLKRKPTEAVNAGSFKLHPSKRHSPNDNRMAKDLSATDVEEEICTQGTLAEGSRKNVRAEHLSPKFGFHQDANMEELGFTMLAENDANIEKAEACANELEDICSMLKKKHEEAKDLLVRALVNNNNLLILNHPIYEGKIHAVQKFAARLMPKELNAGM